MKSITETVDVLTNYRADAEKARNRFSDGVGDSWTQATAAPDPPRRAWVLEVHRVDAAASSLRSAVPGAREQEGKTAASRRPAHEVKAKRQAPPSWGD